MQRLYKDSHSGAVYRLRLRERQSPSGFDEFPVYIICVWLPRSGTWYICAEPPYVSSSQAEARLSELAKQNKWVEISTPPDLIRWKERVSCAEKPI